MVSRARQCLCAVQGAPGGKARSLPWEAAGEGAGSTEMPSDGPHRPLDATKTPPHRPCPLCPRPGQASASSHLTGLVAEPAASTCPSPNNAGQAKQPLPGPGHRLPEEGQHRAGHHGGGPAKAEWTLPSLRQADLGQHSHSATSELWDQSLKLPSPHFLICKRRKCLG